MRTFLIAVTLLATTILLSKSLMLPHAARAAPGMPETADVAAQVDAAWEIAWKNKNATPAPPASNAVFLRRVWLDLAGQVPPVLKAKEFLDDARPDKRARLIEALLASEDFPGHWGRVWAQRLTERRPVRVPGTFFDGRTLAEYLRDALAANRSYRQIATELLTGEGLQDASGPANFFLRYQGKPADVAGAVGKQFMGVTLNCAQCHDHPFAHWKKGDFWGLAAFFGRIKMVLTQEGDLAGIMESRRGELLIPDPGKQAAAKKQAGSDKPADAEAGEPPMKAVAPRLPTKTGRPVVDGKRRQSLAAWLTADDNPYFARNTVNQVWSVLFGVGLVTSLDDLDAAVKEPQGTVLDALARDFAAGGYDLKRLVRVIVATRAYQRGSETPAAGKGKLVNDGSSADYSRFPVRPLSVDQLYQSIAQATGYDPSAAEQDSEPASGSEEADLGDFAAETLGETPLSVQRTLVLLNSDYMNEAVKAGAKVAVTLHGRRVERTHVELLFLATLSRRPTSDEATSMLKLLTENGPARGLEDVLWVLLNSAEFNTNH